MLDAIEEGRDKGGILKKRKRDKIRKTLLGQLVEKKEYYTQVFRKVDKKWFFEKRDRVHVICSSGAGTKNQFNQRKDMCVGQRKRPLLI